MKRLNDFQDQLRGKGLVLGKVIIQSGKADQARKVMSYRMSVSLLSPGTSRVNAHNHSTGLSTDFKVHASTVDSGGNEFRDGVRRSKEKIASADVFAQVIGDALSGGL